MKKFIKNNLIGFIIGISFTCLGVYATTLIASNDVTYDNSSSGLTSTTVKGALDELYEMSLSHCPAGYECTKLPVCKRATSLHTETCSQTSNYCAGDGYTSGSTITYGNLGSEGTLTTGDAFDCDVNSDGEYNSETERFYYVTDMNNDTAVLIYYNNVTGGSPDNMSAYAYNSNTSGYLGPQTAILQLPTTSQWKNVSLTNTTRDIKDNNGTTRVSGFSYEGYAARLLTYEEVQNGCYDGTKSITLSAGLSTKCKFLMENTKYSSSSLKTYGPWLETSSSSGVNYAWIVDGYYRFACDYTVSTTSLYGVRPAIEVLKSNIEI